MIPSTPGSKLKKLIEKRIKLLNLKEKIKIVEKPGQKFFQVMKAHSKKQKLPGCGDPRCLVGKTGGNCKKNEILYLIECKECEDKYPGETSRNGHVRGIEHFEDSISKDPVRQEHSVLLRHINEKHSGRRVEFVMKIVKSFQHDPLRRQCAEAVWIKNIDPSKLINNKTEFHQPGACTR